MPRVCIVCTSSHRSEIEAQLNSGAPHRHVAEQFERSPSAILRHKSHAPKPPKAPDTESGAMPIESPDLTLKMRKFCLAFVGEANGNGTEAARIAEYAGNDVTLAAVAYENLRKPQIQEFIRQLRADAERKASDKILSATEVLVGLTKFAQADPADVFEPDGSFNLQKARERGVSHLIKSVNLDKDTGKVTKVELYNAQQAHIDLGKHHRLFIDRVETDAPQTQQQIEKLTALIQELAHKYT